MARRNATCSADVIFFQTVLLEINNVKMCWTDLHETLRHDVYLATIEKPAMPIS